MYYPVFVLSAEMCALLGVGVPVGVSLDVGGVLSAQVGVERVGRHISTSKPLFRPKMCRIFCVGNKREK
jgi:hypothetical protein